MARSKTISRPIGAWTRNWEELSHNMEVRWPYVFVGAYDDGMHVSTVWTHQPLTVAILRHACGPDGKADRGKSVRRVEPADPERRRPGSSRVTSSRVLGLQEGRLRRLERAISGACQTFVRTGLDNGPDGTEQKKIS